MVGILHDRELMASIEDRIYPLGECRPLRYEEGSMVIENASIVTPDGVLENSSMRIEDGKITDVGAVRVDGTERRLDAAGMYVLPGLVDLHSDAIEKEVQPRPGARFPVNMAILEMDKKLAACGITTMYHSLSVMDNSREHRDKDLAEEIIREVNRLAPKLNVRTKIHARFDIQSAAVVPYMDRLLDAGLHPPVLHHGPHPGAGAVQGDCSTRKEIRPEGHD